MALQDTIIGKIIFHAILSDILDAQSFMLSKSGIKAKSIPNLSPSEKSFHKIAAREFGYFSNEITSIGLWLQSQDWVTRYLYKPHMTKNAIAPFFHELERNAQLSSAEFAEYVRGGDSYTASTSWLRNTQVGALIDPMLPEYNDYLARFHDLDAKIALFNQIHHLKLDLNEMKNPYYGKEVPTITNGKWCFTGPLEDIGSFRCLMVDK